MSKACNQARGERACDVREVRVGDDSAGRWMENTAGYLTTPPALGASGAVNAIVLLNALMFPAHTVYLYFFIPVS